LRIFANDFDIAPLFNGAIDRFDDDIAEFFKSSIPEEIVVGRRREVT
jgi:hypothetical protein